jgi:hypothetical protein
MWRKNQQQPIFDQPLSNDQQILSHQLIQLRSFYLNYFKLFYSYFLNYILIKYIK